MSFVLFLSLLLLQLKSALLFRRAPFLADLFALGFCLLTLRGQRLLRFRADADILKLSFRIAHTTFRIVRELFPFCCDRRTEF